MKRTLLALAAAASLGIAATVTPGTAHAGGGCFGCAVGAGILGGLFAGAIIGSAAAGAPYYDGPPPVYYDEPGPGCYYTRERVWDPYVGAYRRGPRVLVCP